MAEIRKMPPENYNHKTLWVVQNMLNKNQLMQDYQMSGKPYGSMPLVLPPSFCSSYYRHWESCACKVHEKHFWEKLQVDSPI